MQCGYCLGAAVFNESAVRWEHATDGERITNISPGDYVSASHNQAGTRVPTHDLIDDSDDEETYHEVMTTDLNDDGGYLDCGCHGSQREHTCQERNVREFNPASEI